MKRKWVSPDGFSIEIMDNNKYIFCDGNECFVGKYDRLSKSGMVVKLVDIFKERESERLWKAIESARPDSDILREDYPNLNFAPANDLISNEICKGKLCVFFGYPETVSGVLFL
jgi:hypothetical protein